jgi:choline-glycine betaine transporter
MVLTRHTKKVKKRMFMFAHLFTAQLFFPRRQDPAGSNALLVDWRASVTLYFTWLFIGCRAVFFFFIVFIGVKFSHVKLGQKDEEPEFSTAAFFSMIFA